MKVRIKRVSGGRIQVQYKALCMFWINLAEWSFKVYRNPISYCYDEGVNIAKIEDHIKQFKETLIMDAEHAKKPRIIKEFEL